MAAILQNAVVQHQSGNLDAAARGYRQVLAVQPDNTDALNLLGLVCAARSEFDQALTLIEQATEIAPSNPIYRNSLGTIFLALGRDHEALDAFRQAIAMDPAYLEARHNLGETLTACSRFDDAIATYSEGLALTPDDANLHTALGLSLKAAARFEQAGHFFRRALEISPQDPAVHYHLATCLRTAGDLDGTIAALRTATGLAPDFADAYCLLGGALRDTYLPEKALEMLARALALNPNDATAWQLHGITHYDLGRLADAEKSLRKALDLAPTLVDAQNSLGLVLQSQNRPDDAIAAFDQAIAIDPDHGAARSNRALVLLGEGRLKEGWRDYRTRPSIDVLRGRLCQDMLDDRLAGKRLLVLRDQGLGDEIFFMRFVRELGHRKPQIIYRGQGKILSLISRLPFIDEILDEAETDKPTDVDHWVSAGDLPFMLGMDRFGPDWSSVSLSVLPERAIAMAQTLAAFGPPPYIGITWRAGVQKHNRLSKIVPLDLLARTLSQSDGTVIALQRTPFAGEIATFAQTLGRPVHDLTALNDDLETMLALLGQLDDYICVSNTNVHLRAGLGRTSRVLVPQPAEFRWMNSGIESPWFPGTRVYRETYPDGWALALSDLARDLAGKTPDRSG